MSLDRFLELARNRRAMRRFKADPIPDGLLDRLLDAARWAPSGYNLQPTHFVVVTDAELKGKLCTACFSQPQVETAPATIAFVGDPHVVRHNLDRMIEMEMEIGATNDEYSGVLRKYIGLAFDTGPAGIGWLVKALLDIPRSHCVPVVIPVGCGDMADLKKSRLPLEAMVHRNRWAPSY